MKVFLSAEIPLEVPFHDVDSMGIVWHGHYVKYLEIARTALLRRIGLDLQAMRDHGIVYPIATCDLKYVRPLHYGDVVTVRAELLEYENRVKVRYLITTGDGAVTTRAETTQVAVDLQTRELRFDTPTFLLEAIERMGPNPEGTA